MPRQITITMLDHQGNRLVTYTGVLVEESADMLAVRCRWTSQEPVKLGLFTIEPGDVLIEYFYAREPFNIFAVHDPGGALKGWYCNLLESTRICRDSVEWADLALDLLAIPTGKRLLLDEDEFEALQPAPLQRRRATEGLNTLNEWLNRRQHPFSSSHDRA
ncbi:MAG: DUF402 domain-containing protein [Chloroflexi bacterium]|nr:DUF402 domain-containing protein [Chloroflexota bacterium]